MSRSSLPWIRLSYILKDSEGTSKGNQTYLQISYTCEWAIKKDWITKHTNKPLNHIYPITVLIIYINKRLSVQYIN